MQKQISLWSYESKSDLKSSVEEITIEVGNTDSGKGIRLLFDQTTLKLSHLTYRTRTTNSIDPFSSLSSWATAAKLKSRSKIKTPELNAINYPHFSNFDRWNLWLVSCWMGTRTAGCIKHNLTARRDKWPATWLGRVRKESLRGEVHSVSGRKTGSVVSSSRGCIACVTKGPSVVNLCAGNPLVAELQNQKGSYNPKQFPDICRYVQPICSLKDASVASVGSLQCRLNKEVVRAPITVIITNSRTEKVL